MIQQMTLIQVIILHMALLLFWTGAMATTYYVARNTRLRFFLLGAVIAPILYGTGAGLIYIYLGVG